MIRKCTCCNQIFKTSNLEQSVCDICVEITESLHSSDLNIEFFKSSLNDSQLDRFNQLSIHDQRLFVDEIYEVREAA